MFKHMLINLIFNTKKNPKTENPHGKGTLKPFVKGKSLVYKGLLTLLLPMMPTRIITVTIFFRI